MNFGERLQEFRKSRGFSREEMAAILNISVRGYANYENSEREMRFDQLSELFGMGMDIGYLLTGQKVYSSTAPPLSDEERVSYLERIDKLNKELQEAKDEYIKLFKRADKTKDELIEVNRELAEHREKIRELEDLVSRLKTSHHLVTPS